MIYVEDLQVANMSKSAKGTVEEPGKNVSQKIGVKSFDIGSILVRVSPTTRLQNPMAWRIFWLL
ncbi:hypothetical protein [Lonepinella koalarum]|uniref:hypothetical protein n=1 Tax=Lonepinella koalarum TaxID=53417 RepID=UPI00370450D2